MDSWFVAEWNSSLEFKAGNNLHDESASDDMRVEGQL